MAASTEQKVDFLLKKLGYSSSKTGIAEDESSLSGTKKAPFAEPIPSPLVVPDSSVWSNSEWIPTTPPGSDTSYVKTYLAAASGYHMTEDTTVSGSRSFVARTTYNNNSTANLKNWIDTQFGADYIVKVYKGDPNSGGVQLSAAGSGSNDTWFFDYSAGVLNFNGTSVPSGVTSSNIYLVGYRYIGETGVLTPGDDFETRNLNVTGIATVAGSTDLNGNLDVAGVSTFVGVGTFQNDLYVAGDLNVVGDVVYDEVTGRNINISGISTFNVVDINGNLDVDSHTHLDNVSVSGVTTFGGNVDITGTSNLYVSGNLTVDGTETKLNTNTLEVEDINVGIASTASKLSDAQIDGAGITIYSSGGDKTLTWDHSNSRMSFSNDLYAPNVIVGTDLTVGGNLNVTGDVVYDEVTGRNINITGVSTFVTVDINGDIDVDGHTNLDNVSVSGVTTFASDVDITGDVDIDGQTDLDVLNVSEVATFSSTVDVDGQTTLDHLNVSGVSTFAGIGTFTSHLFVGGNLEVKGTTKFEGGTLTLGDADTDNIVFGGEVDSNILPDDDNTFDLGSSAKRWKDVYATNFHGDGSNLTNTGASLSAASGTQRLVVTNLTSGTMTAASTDSDLVFIAGNNLLSLNGNLSVTGVATFTGPITAGSSLGVAGQYMRRTGTGVTWASFPELRQTTSFTATANQTSFTWSHNANFLDVFLNGVKLATTEYTANGSSVVLNSGCFAGDIVEFHSYNIASNYGAGGGGSTTLGGLTDVTISGASNGQVLKYNGSAWVNGTDEEGSVGSAGTWASTPTGISTTKNVSIGGDLNVTGITTLGVTTASTLNVSGVSTFIGAINANGGANISGDLVVGDITASDLNITGIATFANELDLGTATLNVNHLVVSGVTTVAGITSYTKNVTFAPSGGGGGVNEVNFYGGTPDQRMRWRNNGSNSALHLNDHVHLWFGDDMSTQLEAHGNGGPSDHFRWKQYTDYGDNPLHFWSDTVHIEGSPTNSHNTRSIAGFAYTGGVELYYTGTKRLQTSGIGVTVFGQLDATSANFTGNVSVGGTLTYEDVKNVDSIGIVTARTDIHVGAGVSAVGIVTANSFRGDGSQLTGISASSLQAGADIAPRHVNASGIITATSATIGSLGISTIAGNWGASAGVGKTVDTIDISSDDFKTAEYTAWFNYSSGGVSNIQSQKLLVMQDGSNAYSQEFAIMSAPNKVVSLSASITGNIVSILATPESGISGVTTYKLARNTLL